MPKKATVDPVTAGQVLSVLFFDLNGPPSPCHALDLVVRSM